MSIRIAGQVVASAGSLTAHNEDPNAHPDIRELIAQGGGGGSAGSADVAEALRNQNEAEGATEHLYNWVGTLAEYEAQNIATEHPEWIVLITDDVEKDEVKWGDITGDINAQTDLTSLIHNTEMEIRADVNESDSELQTQITAQSAAIAEKQDKLTAGEGITIEGNIISATGGGGASVPDNVYTQDNLIAGKNVTFTEVPPEGGIDEHTLACWHFDDGSIDVVKGITNTSVVYRTDKSNFGNVGLASSTVFNTSEISVTASEEWTIDFWYLPESGTVMRVGFGTTQYVQINNSEIYFNATGKSVSFQYTLSASEWAHCALQYKSGLASVYVNGKLVATDEYSYTGGNFYFWSYGYLDELRVSNIARYTEDFTPPTEPYKVATGPSKTAVNAIVAVPTKTSELENDSGFLTGLPDNVYTQTNLLGGKDIEIIPEPVEGGIDEHTLACWHFTDSAEDEVSGLVMKMASALSSSYSKFGEKSLKMLSSTGSSDISSLGLQPTKKSMTMDFWLYNHGSEWAVIRFGGSDTLMDIRIKKTGSMTFSGTLFESSISLSENIPESFNHIAIQYDYENQEVSFYLNGKNLVKTKVPNVNLPVTGFNYLQLSCYTSNSFISELRISDCVRYTEDFEPPTKPYQLAEPTGNMVVNFVGESLQKGADYVIESYNEGTNWYRVYKSGWIEQGGYVTGAETYTLLKPMMDTNYIVLVTERDTTAPSNTEGSPRAGAISTTQIYINGGKGSSGTINYYVCGQGA